MLATARAATDGTFETDLPKAVYAVTATDAEQSGFLVSADGTRDSIEIRLDTSCHRFDGRLRTRSQVPNEAVVRLARESDEYGDEFGAAVAPDGSFRACIPAGSYSIKLPKGFIARETVAIVVPYRGLFEYRTDLLEDADRVATSLSGLAPETTDSFVAGVAPTTKVIGLAETNHGTREFYDERTALALSLARKQGVRLLMLEAGYGEVLALDDYVNGRAIDIERAVRELGYWTWDTKTFLKSLAQIRAFNASLAPSKRIHVVGFDVQNTAGSIKYLGKQGVLSQQEKSSLEKLVADKGKAWTTLSVEERTMIRATLLRIAAKRGTGGVSSKSNRTVLAAKSLLLRFELAEVKGQLKRVEARDAGMARMALDALATEPSGRATLWAHLSHLGREFVIGAHTMGAHLATELGDGYRVYGLLARGGSARAWDPKGEIGVIADTLRAPPPHSLEAVLAAHAGGQQVTYWNFSRATGEAADWLQGMHVVRTFGAVFLGEYELGYWNLASFDGAILFDSVSPTEPTPTGERRATRKGN